MKIAVMTENGTVKEVVIREGEQVTIFPESRNEYDALAASASQYRPFCVVKDGKDDLLVDGSEQSAAMDEKASRSGEMIGRTINDRAAERMQRKDPTFMLLPLKEHYAMLVRNGPDDENPMRLITQIEHKDFLRGMVHIAANFEPEEA